jgi:FdhD protein
MKPDLEPFAAQLRIAHLRQGDANELRNDLVAVEEPLEIRVNGRSFAVVMRTPGHDLELSAGHLFAEGIVAHRDQISDLAPCRLASGAQADNVVGVQLQGVSERLLHRETRATPLGSSCGTCGKESIEQVHRRFPPLATAPKAAARVIYSLTEKLAAQQNVFQHTGGLHGVALFTLAGELVKAREDVGRHNAVDKLLGYALLNGLMPLERHVLFVSGRISFEIVQKALAARIPVVAGISAPTSLAVEFARESGQALLGFVREGRANVYAGEVV